jgi:hypothetical protein
MGFFTKVWWENLLLALLYLLFFGFWSWIWTSPGFSSQIGAFTTHVGWLDLFWDFFLLALGIIFLVFPTAAPRGKTLVESDRGRAFATFIGTCCLITGISSLLIATF